MAVETAGHMAEEMDMRKRKETMKNMYSSGKRAQEVIVRGFDSIFKQEIRLSASHLQWR